MITYEAIFFYKYYFFANIKLNLTILTDFLFFANINL